MNDKMIETLIEDIGLVLTGKAFVSETQANQLAEKLTQTIVSRLTESKEPRQLSMSALGTPDRKLWYKMNKPELEEELDAATRLKFLYGDILEQVVIFLAKVAGHDVDHEQLEVESDGVKGHLDCTIDGCIVDAKSASQFSFQKFKKGLDDHNDSFGYRSQLGCYMAACDASSAYFLVINKESGELFLSKQDASFNDDSFAALVKHKSAVVSQENKPENKCYEPVPNGKSGNMKLHTNCGYCGFKQDCWKDANDGKGLIPVPYSTGVVYHTHIERTPNSLKEKF